MLNIFLPVETLIDPPFYAAYINLSELIQRFLNYMRITKIINC